MHNDGSSPTLRNCSFVNNYGRFTGGGLYNSNLCSPEITNCSFIGNETNSGGGGIYNEKSSLLLAGCTFLNNAANGGVV